MKRFVLCAWLLVLAAPLVRGQIPQHISYQGLLVDTETGEPITGTMSFAFSLYRLETGGAPLWSETQTVEVEEGLFHVYLGASTPLTLPFDAPYWLGVQVDGESELLPRVPLSASPYSLNAHATLVEPEPGQTLLVRDAAGAVTHRLDAGGDAFHAGRVTFGKGAGVTLAAAPADTALVVRSPAVPVLYVAAGDTTGDAGTGKGTLNSEEVTGAIQAETAGSGSAVHGWNRGPGNGNGVTGRSATGSGVHGTSERYDGVSGSGRRNGVTGLGEENGVEGIGLGSATGVHGHSVDGDGVSATSVNGTALHARGGTDGKGQAALFEGRVTINGPVDINGGKVRIDEDGEIYARSFHTVAEDGTSTAALDAQGNAAFASVQTGPVEASAVLAHAGVDVDGAGGGFNRLGPEGLRFVAPLGAEIGFWDSASGTFYTEGDFMVGGAKNAIVETPTYGPRKLYAEEAAAVYFFDRGQGRLMNGEAIIRLDPVFLETVTVDDGHPMLVQVTLTADCNGLFVAEKTPSGFLVRELQGGTSNATFDWEVAARRKGYESVRLQRAGAAGGRR